MSVPYRSVREVVRVAPMGRNPDFLNDKQIAVLKWVKDGCPADVFTDGYAHRITAKALETKGLIAIRGRGPTWSATITSAGEAWKPAPEPISHCVEADELMQHVVERGRFSLDGRRDLARYQELVKESIKAPSRPRGRQLVLRNTGPWDEPSYFIELDEYFDDRVEAQPVPVAPRVSKAHPTISGYFTTKDWTYVSPDLVPRATRVLQAIADYITRRGQTVLPPSVVDEETIRKNRLRGVPGAVFAIGWDGWAYDVRIREIPQPSAPKNPPAGTPGPERRPIWMHRRTWKFISTGRLELTVDRVRLHTKFKDERWLTLEEQLSEVLRQVEVDALEADWKYAKEQQEELHRKERWEAAMANAREQYAIEVQYSRFREMSESWENINRRRGFLAAARQRLQTYTGDDRDAIDAQLAFIERQVDVRDPLNNLSNLLLGTVRPPTSEDLKPYLGRFSPYGPDVR